MITEKQIKPIVETPHKSFSCNDLEGKAIAHMEERGYVFNGSFDTTGRTIKFSGRPNEEGKKGDKTEWYKAEQKVNQGIISLQVTYNSHHDSLKSDKNHVFYSGTEKPLSDYELRKQQEKFEKLKNDREKLEAEEKKKREIQAVKDRERFEKALKIGDSPYLERKRVKAHGIRFEIKAAAGKEETILLIPMRDAKGEIQALEEIYPSKRLFTGSKKPRDKNFTNSTHGLFHVLGTIVNGKQIRVSGGYATAYSCYESTGENIPHAVAFSDGAFQTIVPILRRLYQDSHILICTDNDESGRSAAKAMAKTVENCSFVFPVFPEGKGTKPERGALQRFQ